jgi:hypothetical protein
MRVVDLVAGVEISITVRTDVYAADGQIAPAVLLALREASYVILGGSVAAISPHALDSPEHSFVVSRDEFAGVLGEPRYVTDEMMRQFLQDQDIEYLDYINRSGTDVLSLARGEWKPVSPDGRFFYKHGICLAETGEKIVDGIPNWIPIDWVYDGMIIHRFSTVPLFYVTSAGFYHIHEPWLKLRVPAEYTVSGMDPDRD